MALALGGQRLPARHAAVRAAAVDVDLVHAGPDFVQLAHAAVITLSKAFWNQADS